MISSIQQCLFYTYDHGWRNHPNHSWRSQNAENPQVQSSRPTPPGFQNRRYALFSHQAPFGSSNVDKVIFAHGTLTFIVQKADSKV